RGRAPLVLVRRPGLVPRARRPPARPGARPGPLDLLARPCARRGLTAVSLDLTVLGCSGSYPGPGAACSGYLVRGGGANVAVDLGPGSLANLQEHLDLDDLDAVVLTHAHPDHWTDLCGLHTAWKYALGREGLQVWGTAQGRELAEAITGGMAPTIDWRDLDTSSLLVVGGLCFTFAPTVHYLETSAVRVDGPAGGRCSCTPPTPGRRGRSTG